MPTISKAEYAKHRGVSKAAVSIALKAQRITATPDGRIDVEQADRQWEANSNKHQTRNRTAPIEEFAVPPAGPEAETQDGDFAEAQRQNEWEKVWKQRLARKVAEKKLLDRDDVRKTWERHRDTIKNRLLLLESKVPPECRAMVGREVRSLLHSLTEDRPDAA